MKLGKWGRRRMVLAVATAVALVVTSAALAGFQLPIVFQTSTNPNLPAALLNQPMDGPDCTVNDAGFRAEIDAMRIAYAAHELWGNYLATTPGATDPAAGSVTWNQAWGSVYTNVIHTLCQLATQPPITTPPPPQPKIIYVYRYRTRRGR